jgi:small conductance mechanosensitive channel
VRSIRLRDLADTVHTVPFSKVTSVKNLTKDYSNVLARITVSYSEDLDRVVDILREASERMLEDEALRTLILDTFEFMGVESLDEFSVVLLVRVRTAAAKQLTVGRAFNRLVKIAFDEHGIASREPARFEMAGPPRLLAGGSLDAEPSAQRRRA